MQRLLRRAGWDVDRVRDGVRDYVVEHLGDRDGVLIADETGWHGDRRGYLGTATGWPFPRMVTGGLHVTKAAGFRKISARRYADRRAVGVKGL
jgi:hypothetical protein